ncbi:MAG: hypothetical protein B6245_14950 [Desulfobacteraceae bacterium 4572_88]|nr:MAG: hypothetical protein B6245_14950 [Desulfobacteraceae bacterium 4572_88]
MNAQVLTSSLSRQLGMPEDELIRKSLLAFIEKEIWLAESQIADIRERYNVLSEAELSQAIREGTVAPHPAWEDYIVWKNKSSHIRYLNHISVR